MLRANPRRSSLLTILAASALAVAACDGEPFSPA